jgi:hypothetical protein
MALIMFDEIFEVRRTDFLFKLPDEFKIERQAVIDRVPNREHGCQRRPFVVGSPSPFVSVAILVEGERRFIPLRSVGGLHVQVVVDRHRRIFLVSDDRAENHRVAGRRNDLRPGSQVVQILRRDLAASLDVGDPIGIAADAWSFDEGCEFVFEFVTAVADVVVEVLIKS